MQIYINLVSGDGQREQGQNLNDSMGAALTNQPEGNQSSKVDDKPELQTSSTSLVAGCSATQATSAASCPSSSSNPLLDAKECEDLIRQYFADEIVHSYYTCPSRLCNSLGHEEVARLKDQK